METRIVHLGGENDGGRELVATLPLEVGRALSQSSESHDREPMAMIKEIGARLPPTSAKPHVKSDGQYSNGIFCSHSLGYLTGLNICQFSPAEWAQFCNLCTCDILISCMQIPSSYFHPHTTFISSERALISNTEPMIGNEPPPSRSRSFALCSRQMSQIGARMQ